MFLLRGSPLITAEGLVRAIVALVQTESESGRRAQAVVAGLMDVFAGPERVESGPVKDPSRVPPENRASPAGPVNLGLDDADLHRLEENIADCTEAIRFDPDSASASGDG